MILRRISEGIRKQDWFVVILEVLIVVVGLFIGLQAAMLNDGKLRNLAIYRDVLQTLVVGTVQQVEDDYTDLIMLLDARIAEIG